MSERIRVVQVVNSMAAAGAERTTVEIARSLPRDEFDVHVMVVRDGPLRTVLEDAGVPLHVIGGEFDWRWPGVVKRMAHTLKALEPTIVHTHMIGSDIVGGMAARRERVPIVLSTQHDTYHRALIYDVFRRFSSRWLDAVVAISPAVVDYCRTDLHMPAERVHTIENAIDSCSFEPSITPRHDPLTFGSIGTLIPIKGHIIALEAMATVVRSVPGARLMIAGQGPLRETLLRRAKELGISDSLVLCGLVSDVPAFLAQVDIVVHPSVQEAFGLAIVEAMAARKPVVASDLPAVRSILDAGRAGELVPLGDVAGFAASMLRLATDREHADALVDVAYERVTHRYSRERLASEYAALYRELLVARRGGARGAEVP